MIATGVDMDETNVGMTPMALLILEDNLAGINLVVAADPDEVGKVLEAHRAACLGQLFYGREYTNEQEYEREFESFMASFEDALKKEGAEHSRLLPTSIPLKVVKPRQAWERPGWPRPPMGFPVPEDAVRFRNEAPVPGYC